jgi:branched-chain amino acid aminotransferase
VETPPLSSGCLEGVTRGLLLELAPQAGVPMVERTLMPEDLFSADEIFITSTNRSLLGIGEIAGHSYAAAPGPVTQKLEKMFAAYMNDYVAQHAAAR